MARDRRPAGPQDNAWAWAQKLFQSGSPEFVEAIRAVANAKELAPFAETWYTDTRIEARRLLTAYLDRPLNAVRHEPLVKRLFKFADNAGDDVVMARFMVALDRSVRRKLATKRTWDYRNRTWVETPQVVTPPDTELTRDDNFISYPWFQKNREQFTAGKFLFSIPTRNYLRRRAWRYFRRLGRKSPDRYVPAVCVALKLYTDADVPDGLALLDNWGLVHVLFHHSPTLVARPTGWRVAPNGSLGRLQPDPIFRKLWLRSPDPILDLVKGAKCRPVRAWAAQMLKRHFPDVLTKLPVETLLEWLESSVPELNDLAAELLEKATGLERIPIERWLMLVETAPAGVLERICELIGRLVKPEQVGFAQAVRMAMTRPVPLAKLGQQWLAGKRPSSDEEVQAVFGLREAEAEPLRAGLVRWACKVLSEYSGFKPLWVLEFLDGRHEEVREVGWEWLQTEPRASEDVVVWQRLLESPYDNVRIRLVGLLEDRAKERKPGDEFSPGLVRFLWASVLLNIHRGGRAKPFVVRQIMDRLGKKPEEAGDLLPIVAAALRSTRGPEFRAGLAGVAGFVAKYPQHRAVVEHGFPELKLG
jgi:hypothetical protein